MTKIQSFRDLTVWQKSMDITEAVYALCKNLPIEERYGLISQMQRAAVSIPSNIAEGCQRNNFVASLGISAQLPMDHRQN